MNHSKQEVPTKDRLVETGRKVFSAKGFDASSLREITALAGANLGAVTYHFGSKTAFYEAVLASLLVPFRECVAAAAEREGAPLTRIAGVVRDVFGYLYDHPELPRILVQEIASGRRVPPLVIETLMANHGHIAALITEGQRDGSIRAGDPRLMALSIGAPPMFLNVVRQVLHDAIAVNQGDTGVRRAIVETAVAIAVRGLATHPDATP